jgi:pimeloyl-ACP methyl ester carboxylesterase
MASAFEYGPAARSYYSQRLRLHYVDWGNEGAPPLLLVHGGRDHCRNWDWVARALRDRYHIIAPDLRGHGDSQWMVGGSYAMVDYVYDIAQLVHQLRLAPLRIMGHSLGGAICLQYAGLFPESVSKCVTLEGFGPPPRILEKRMGMAAQDRLLDWVKQLRDLAGRLPRRYASIDEACARMQDANPHLTPEQARHLTIHGANQNEDGSFSWKFDNYVRAFAPYAFHTQDMFALWQKITSPVLLLWGSESWMGDPHADDRLKHLPDVKVERIEGAGHWVHHDQLDRVLDLVTPFLK